MDISVPKPIGIPGTVSLVSVIATGGPPFIVAEAADDDGGSRLEDSGAERFDHRGARRSWVTTASSICSAAASAWARSAYTPNAVGPDPLMRDASAPAYSTAA